jgi:hypothetical protein
MPDFHVLREQLHSDLSRVDWSPADDIRATGTRRRRTQTLVVAGVSAAVVLVIASVALLLPGGRPNSAPVGGPSPSSQSPSAVAVLPAPSPSPSPSPTASPSPSPGLTTTPPVPMLPAQLLLTASDVTPYFAGIEEPFAQPYQPNPFLGCGTDGLVGSGPVGVIGTGFTHGDANSVRLGGETVFRYDSSAHAGETVAAVRQLMLGACAGIWQVDPATPSGDGSILFFTTRQDVVVPQAAHGNALYHAVLRRGAYLVWITIVDEYQTSDGRTVATTLAQRAVTRLCEATVC